MNAESERLLEEAERKKNWKRFGPYLAERQWATVREDYSPYGDAWNYFPFEQARSRTYRWGEDGLLGITDRECRLCFAPALWNGKDPILKERLFGLTATQGNHGEDVKECYFYLNSTPTHSYMKALYRYPFAEFPYKALVDENARRGRDQPEYEITDTGIFKNDRYFDVFVEYAKNAPDDILIEITVFNPSEERATIHLLPTLWYRNTWIWDNKEQKPVLEKVSNNLVRATHPTLGTFFFAIEELGPWLFTENETNLERLFGVPNKSPFVKDAFHDYVLLGDTEKVNPQMRGTKCAPYIIYTIEPKETKVFRARLYAEQEKIDHPFRHFGSIFDKRKEEANTFYKERIIPHKLSAEEFQVARQAYAGLLWNKQFYNYVVNDWLAGDPNEPKPPAERYQGRNSDWKHVFMRDVISMPDKWEYPWFAAWDLAFHMIPMAKIDPDFAKSQLVLFLREWYLHPNGQMPAYEFSFSDVNPPVHAWAAWRVYKITGKKGARDRGFLESVFQKLLLNFTWWVNRKDIHGHHIFSGGFLGLDNIGVFDRSQPLPSGTYLQQADGTAWMGFYCLTMLNMALELAAEDPVYEDMASKFFEHFIHIADAINELGGTGLWDPRDGFYYDRLRADGMDTILRTRSLVGLLPLIAVAVLQDEHINKLPGFAKRMKWFLAHRKELESVTTLCSVSHTTGNRLLALPTKERLEQVLRYVLDENEFLSPYGIRSLSKIHAKQPFILDFCGQRHTVDYVPGEGNSSLFGGNSNWRGPIWLPINFLLIEALERYHYFYGEGFKVECPVGSGKMLTLKEVAGELSRRLCLLFLPKPDGKRPYLHPEHPFHQHPYHLFHEYFHGETGQGLGASHQTGWTALIAKLLEE